MKSITTVSQNKNSDNLPLSSEYAKKLNKKKNKKTKKTDKNNLKTILEQMQLQHSSLSQLIFKW